ncbi:alpha/beta fold hydrolase [Nocardia sp. NBC_01388]|uniref:alpha/beta fold hydrolase n=1 Tax=Nocardia sp. NBC_01388 TaxID=2903596 RepID=UPI003254DEAE
MVAIDAGTPVAVLLALRHPDRVRRLVVMEALLGTLPAPRTSSPRVRRGGSDSTPSPASPKRSCSATRRGISSGVRSADRI